MKINSQSSRFFSLSLLDFPFSFIRVFQCFSPLFLFFLLHFIHVNVYEDKSMYSLLFYRNFNDVTALFNLIDVVS